MNSQVTYSTEITPSLMYGQNPAKGGEILMCQGVVLSHTPKQQAEDWERIARDDLKYKLCNIVISFSRNDTERLRQMKDQNKRIAFQKEVIMAWMDEIKKRGTDIRSSPFIIAHHGNTKCDHFHINILMTTFEGKRFGDRFIAWNSQRACAKISEEYGLEACPAALENEHFHQAAIAEGQQESKRRKRQRTDDINKIQDKMRRKQKAAEAKKRRAGYKFIIEQTAKTCTKDNFVAKLKEQGMEFQIDSKGEYSIIVDVDGKQQAYTFKKLGVDMSIIPNLRPAASGSEPKPFAVKRQSEPQQGVKHNGGLKRSPSAPEGGSRDDNREWEVGSSEGYEDAVRRSRGLKM